MKPAPRSEFMNSVIAKSVFGRWTLVLVSALPVGTWAQTQIEVKQGTVVYVSGNELIVRMADDQLKHFVVPSDSRFTVDGKEVGIQDLKAGTKLTQTITTTTEERMVT